MDIKDVAEGQSPETFSDFVRSHFYALLMTAIFAAMLGTYIHTLHHGSDQSSLTWFQQKTGEVLASICTLAAGAAKAYISRSNGDGK